MMESGKTRRLGRIFRDDGKTVIVPMDHGVPAGPIEGLGDIRRVVNQVAKGGADAILVHAGVAKTVDTTNLGLILHLSGATRLTGDPNWKTQLCTVKKQSVWAPMRYQSTSMWVRNMNKTCWTTSREYLTSATIIPCHYSL